MPTKSKSHATYSPEFKEQALLKARQRGKQSIRALADELNISFGTLKSWLKSPRAEVPHAAPLPVGGSAHAWSLAQRLQALIQSHALTGEALAAWCREKGLFEHQLHQWHAAFCQPSSVSSPVDGALRALQRDHAQLQRQLLRKDKALAEAAALLVLQKKFQALWEEEAK
jgi:hypothetical protein